MTEKFRVLIVDDHQEIRTALRANLEALEIDLDLVDVPSGEEAIVEVVGNGIDLLIADIGLPGLSGLELFRKLKTTYPEMQVIIITGMDDEEIHQEIADLGADAFFLKPLKMPVFLNAVRSSMGLDPVLEDDPEELIKLTKKPLHSDITTRIADLRGELGAISIMVIESRGVIAAETGIVPDMVYESHVMPLLLSTFSTINKISSYLGKKNPASVWYFSGEKYDLFWSHVNTEYGMMIITNPVTQNNDLTWVLTTVELAIQEVQETIHGLTGKPSASTSKSSKAAKSKETKAKTAANKTKVKVKTAKAKLPEESSEGTKGSTKKTTKTAQKKKPVKITEPETNSTSEESNVHDFWKAATLEEEFQNLDSPDSLSFDQAQKLGFIPGGDSF